LGSSRQGNRDNVTSGWKPLALDLWRSISSVSLRIIYRRDIICGNKHYKAVGSNRLAGCSAYRAYGRTGERLRDFPQSILNPRRLLELPKSALSTGIAEMLQNTQIVPQA
jgi:hypothetical protein